MNLRYRVTLSAEERTTLENLVSGGKGRVRRLKRAQILLAADSGATAETIALNVAVGTSTVYRTKQRFVEEGLEEALTEEPRPGAERKLSGSDRLLEATGRPGSLDDGTIGRRDGPPDPAREALVRDSPSSARREGAEALAEEDVMHPEGRRGIRGAHGGCVGSLRAEPPDKERPICAPAMATRHNDRPTSQR